MEWYIKCWCESLNFSDRASRKEFWLFTLFNWLIIITLEYFSRKNGLLILSLLLGLYQLAVFLPSIAVAIRRMHDINCRGWWILINFIPILGNLIYLVLCAQSGTQGPNRFGPEPND